jgi:hypothetical protein
MPYQSAGCCFTHFPIEFDLSNFNYNNKSDLSPFTLPDGSIDMIEDEYNLMTDRLRH